MLRVATNMVKHVANILMVRKSQLGEDHWGDRGLTMDSLSWLYKGMDAQDSLFRLRKAARAR